MFFYKLLNLHLTYIYYKYLYFDILKMSLETAESCAFYLPYVEDVEDVEDVKELSSKQDSSTYDYYLHYVEYEEKSSAPENKIDAALQTGVNEGICPLHTLNECGFNYTRNQRGEYSPRAPNCNNEGSTCVAENKQQELELEAFMNYYREVDTKMCSPTKNNCIVPEDEVPSSKNFLISFLLNFPSPIENYKVLEYMVCVLNILLQGLNEDGSKLQLFGVSVKDMSEYMIKTYGKQIAIECINEVIEHFKTSTKSTQHSCKKHLSNGEIILGNLCSCSKSDRIAREAAINSI